ncbi:MAG TPA: hypothetical protein VFY45_18215, partial [Baekduia sp.]|nr:hypothetical protein [Baekduia sp.]
MNADLQRIGLLRSVALVALCALLAFALWTASGASLGAHGTAEVKIRALPADRTPTTASTPLPSKSKKHARAQPTAVTTARRYLCTSASGKRYHVSARAS